jgi:hypothetical protein
VSVVPFLTEIAEADPLAPWNDTFSFRKRSLK